MSKPAEPTPIDDAVFRILTVCTGNISRSPQAEQLLRARLPRALSTDPTSIEVTSAGTMAQDGAPMESRAATEAQRLGITDTGTHRARHLRAAQIDNADLVIALALEHRGAAARAVPRANARVFTLIELTRSVELLAAGGAPVELEPLADGDGAAFLRRAVAAARTARALLPHAATKHLDIDDPYGRSAAVYRRSADAVADHVDRLATALAALARG